MSDAIGTILIDETKPNPLDIEESRGNDDVYVTKIETSGANNPTTTTMLTSRITAHDSAKASDIGAEQRVAFLENLHLEETNHGMARLDMLSRAHHKAAQETHVDGNQDLTFWEPERGPLSSLVQVSDGVLYGVTNSPAFDSRIGVLRGSEWAVTDHEIHLTQLENGYYGFAIPLKENDVVLFNAYQEDEWNASSDVTNPQKLVEFITKNSYPGSTGFAEAHRHLQTAYAFKVTDGISEEVNGEMDIDSFAPWSEAYARMYEKHITKSPVELTEKDKLAVNALIKAINHAPELSMAISALIADIRHLAPEKSQPDRAKDAVANAVNGVRDINQFTPYLHVGESAAEASDKMLQEATDWSTHAAAMSEMAEETNNPVKKSAALMAAKWFNFMYESTMDTHVPGIKEDARRYADNPDYIKFAYAWEQRQKEAYRKMSLNNVATDVRTTLSDDMRPGEEYTYTDPSYAQHLDLGEFENLEGQYAQITVGDVCDALLKVGVDSTDMTFWNPDNLDGRRKRTALSHVLDN